MLYSIKRTKLIKLQIILLLKIIKYFIQLNEQSELNYKLYYNYI